jgi:hypothetical protein
MILKLNRGIIRRRCGAAISELFRIGVGEEERFHAKAQRQDAKAQNGLGHFFLCGFASSVCAFA